MPTIQLAWMIILTATSTTAGYPPTVTSLPFSFGSEASCKMAGDKWAASASNSAGWWRAGVDREYACVPIKLGEPFQQVPNEQK
jgi:hypothetical protein